MYFYLWRDLSDIFFMEGEQGHLQIFYRVFRFAQGYFSGINCPVSIHEFIFFIIILTCSCLLLVFKTIQSVRIDHTIFHNLFNEYRSNVLYINYFQSFIPYLVHGSEVKGQGPFNVLQNDIVFVCTVSGRNELILDDCIRHTLQTIF